MPDHRTPTMGSLLIAAARADDLDAVRALLVASGLPDVDVAERFPEGFVVVREGAAIVAPAIVATAGLEVHGDVGLLRSVAVASSRRGTGVGRRLVDDRVRAARAQQLRAVYLLTTTAADWVARLGFERVPRQSAPDALQRSTEFASVCPASAVCMALRLGSCLG